MDRRAFITVACGIILAAPVATGAQPGGKVYRIGILSATPAAKPLEAFLQALRDLGWIEGQNITVDRRDAAVLAQGEASR